MATTLTPVLTLAGVYPGSGVYPPEYPGTGVSAPLVQAAATVVSTLTAVLPRGCGRLPGQRLPGPAEYPGRGTARSLPGGGVSYARRYPGGFVDYPDTSTPVDAEFLNGVEDALVSGGAGGGSDANYVFTQVSAASSWNVNHGLGKFPAVSVVDSGGSELIPDISYIDSNHVTLGFGAPTSGRAYFN